MEVDAQQTAASSSGKAKPWSIEETLVLAMKTSNEQLDKAVSAVKVSKWKFVFLTVTLIVLQVVQIILVQTANLPSEVARWLFTGFSIFTVGFKLLEEFWPLRQRYNEAKQEVLPLWAGKHRMEYSHIVTVSGGEVIDLERSLSQILPPEQCPWDRSASGSAGPP